MYRLRVSEDVEKQLKMYNKIQMAKIIGLHPDTLRRVITYKQDCSKLVAYGIVKFIDPDSEVEDYFDYIKGGE